MISTLRFGLLFVKNETKQKELILIKLHLLNLITSIVFEFSIDFDNEIYFFYNENFKPQDIWGQVTYNINLLLKKLGNLELSLDLYLTNTEFSSAPELELSGKFFIFLYYWKGKKFLEELDITLKLTDEDINVQNFLRQIVKTIECICQSNIEMFTSNMDERPVEDQEDLNEQNIQHEEMKAEKDEEEIENKKENKLILFQMPQICFNLSLESQQNFETKANRISRQSKLESLTKNLDLF